MKSKEFFNRLRDLTAQLRADIAAHCAGWDTNPALIAKRQQAVRDPVQGFQYFVDNYFPHYIRHRSQSNTHRYLFARLSAILQSTHSESEALAAPRGESKSTIVSRLFTLYCIVTEQKHFILLISDSIDQSTEFLEAIKVELEDNPRLRSDFADACGVGSPWQVGKIIARNGVKVQAAGAAKKLRGLVHGAFRPDLVILDDIENDENVRTAEQRQKLHNWLTKAVMPLGAAGEKFDVVFIGTVLHYDSVLNRTLHNPAWTTHRFQAVIRWPDNMALWDDWEAIYRNEGKDTAQAYYQQHQAEMDKGAVVSWAARPIYDLMLIRVRDGHDTFDSEYQNDPVSLSDAIFSDSIHFWVNLQDDVVYYGACDPSMGQPAAGRDPSAIGIGAFNRKHGILQIVEAAIVKRVPDRIISDIISYQRQYNCLLWVIETVAFQAFLMQELIKRSAAAGVPVPARGVTPSASKALRIESLQPHMKNKLILLHNDHKTLIDQFRHYPKAAHDDGPDMVHMLWAAAVSGNHEAALEALYVPEPALF